jgi:peptidoglycan hydrolase-like protein with peptidoglycan-binding domain
MREFLQNIFISLGMGAMLFSMTGCDVIYGMLDKNGAQEKELVGDLVPLGRNDKVEEIQTLLKIYGYDPGNPDGVLGLKTREAIERFQKEQGLELTRFVNKDTWDKLNVFQDNGLIVDLELNTMRVQTLLKNAGFNPGSIDGEMGKKTIEAVEKFQAKHKLNVDGKIGYNTLKALVEYAPEEAPAPLPSIAQR